MESAESQDKGLTIGIVTNGRIPKETGFSCARARWHQCLGWITEKIQNIQRIQTVNGKDEIVDGAETCRLYWRLGVAVIS